MSEIIEYDENDEITNNIERCFTCKFFMGNKNSESGGGVCYRYPPVIDQSGMIVDILEATEFGNVHANAIDYCFDDLSARDRSWYWARPIVEESDYCGEFKNKS